MALSWSSTWPAPHSVSWVCVASPILRHTPCSMLPDRTFMAVMSWERLLPHSTHVPIAWSYSTSPCPAICRSGMAVFARALRCALLFFAVAQRIATVNNVLSSPVQIYVPAASRYLISTYMLLCQ